MIEKVTEIIKWWSSLSNYLKVVTFMLFFMIWLGYKEYKSNESEKLVLKNTIDHERKQTIICEEEKKEILNIVLDIRLKSNKIDSINSYDRK